MKKTHDIRRVQHGDWQTPQGLAADVVGLVKKKFPRLNSIVEPTCGEGTFLQAASNAYPKATLLGFDISSDHVTAARERLSGHGKTSIAVGDFFETDWNQVFNRLRGPILILGNPPWVTNSTLGALGASNSPKKVNHKHLSGLDAMTGKSNFDISESMINRMIEAAWPHGFVLAMLCKSSVARRVMVHCESQDLDVDGEVRTIDARQHFSAAVDAVLLIINTRGHRSSRRSVQWDVFSSLDATHPIKRMGIIEGRLCSDVNAYGETCHLEGVSEIEWRSGVKHDCSRIMELMEDPRGLVNGLGELVRIEANYVFPLLKGSDLANNRLPHRRVIVTQRALGDDTKAIREIAPATWTYLKKHQGMLNARKSSIYQNQPAFSMFGIGPYSFAPYKVAICGLYKRLSFTVVRPIGGRPVMVDDTAYFLPCESEMQAEEIGRALNSATARKFFEARLFWDAKRPVSKSLLQSLSISALLGVDKRDCPGLAHAIQQTLRF